MAKLYFKQSIVQNQMLPNLSAAIDGINASYGILSSFYVPGSFPYRAAIDETGSALQQCQTKLQLERQWCEKSIQIFENRFSEIEEQVQGLSINKIEPKENRIA